MAKAILKYNYFLQTARPDLQKQLLRSEMFVDWKAAIK